MAANAPGQGNCCCISVVINSCTVISDIKLGGYDIHCTV